MSTPDIPGPVEPTEIVYRRILKKYYDPSLPTPVDIQAFRPSSEDDNGISLVRKKYTSSPSEALAGVAPEKRGLYHVAELPVSLFSSLNISVIENKIDECIGHALAPAINTNDYHGDKKKDIKDLMKSLAEAASKNIILLPT